MENSFKSSLAFFLRESFRPRTKEEYKAVFKCGVSFDRRPVPWLYLRVLAAGFILFAVSVLINRLCDYSSAFTMAVALGGLFANVPLLIFFYELNPRRDISFLTLSALAVVGGVLSSALTLVGYEFIYGGNDNPWVSYLWTGFLEELAKMAAALPVIIILRKKNPFACFLIGIAVGTGYSVFEDFGYIYAYGGNYLSGDTWVVLMSVGRGFSCFCSHAPWTGVICWAFAAFKKPWLNVRFYGVVVASMLLHYLADVPFYADGFRFLEGFNAGWAIEAFVVAGIVVMVVLMLRRSYAELGCVKRTEEERAKIPLARKSKLSHAGNVTAVLCAVFVSAATCAGCALQFEEKSLVSYFGSDGEFISFIQNEKSLSADWARLYDGAAADYSQFIENGELKSATQKVAAGGYDYYYVYVFGESAELSAVGVKIDGKVHYCRRMTIYSDGSKTVYYGYPPNYEPVGDDPAPPPEPVDPPEEPSEPVDPPEVVKTVEYFHLAEAGVNYDSESGRFKVIEKVPAVAPYAIALALGVASAVVAAGGTAAVIILKIKSGRKNDDR